MPHPSISLRKHYQLPPQPPTEATSTLVLTSPLSQFVDLRIRLTSPSPTFNPNTPLTDVLDWGFAGTCVTSPLPSSNDTTQSIQGNKSESWRSTWLHYVDSSTTQAEEVKDEADMFTLGNGDVLEKGENVDEGGKVTRYEELWEDVPVGKVRAEVWRWCVVLRVEGEARGMVVRVGDWCQGIARKGKGVAVERWKWGEQKGWQRVVRIGEGQMPCAVTFDLDGLKERDTIEVGGSMWKVTEKYQWT